MPSSPAESALADSLRGLCQRYDLAYEALVRDDLDRVGVLLQEADRLLAAVTQLAPGATVPADVHRQATDSHGRLVAALGGSMAAVQADLGRVRLGRRALQGYGARGADRVGDRIESRG
jgi:hypothetical protein